jgi:hypothetical protein
MGTPFGKLKTSLLANSNHEKSSEIFGEPAAH